MGFQERGVESRESRLGGEMEPWDEIMGGAVESISSLSEISDRPRQFSCLPELEFWEESMELEKLENWLAEVKSVIREILLELEKRLEVWVAGPSEKGLALAPELWLSSWDGNLIGVLTSLSLGSGQLLYWGPPRAGVVSFSNPPKVSTRDWRVGAGPGPKLLENTSETKLSEDEKPWLPWRLSLLVPMLLINFLRLKLLS